MVVVAEWVGDTALRICMREGGGGRGGLGDAFRVVGSPHLGAPCRFRVWGHLPGVVQRWLTPSALEREGGGGGGGVARSRHWHGEVGDAGGGGKEAAGSLRARTGGWWWRRGRVSALVSRDGRWRW